MMRLDNQALICDFAETYHIYDYKLLPARKAAVYAAGLRDSSRIKEKMNNEKIPRDIFLQAAAVDYLGIICHALSGRKGSPQASILGELLGIEEKAKKRDISTYDSPEEFEKAWRGGSGDGRD